MLGLVLGLGLERSKSRAEAMVEAWQSFSPHDTPAHRKRGRVERRKEKGERRTEKGEGGKKGEREGG